MKKFEVAVICDKNGNEIGCLKCKLVDEKDYEKLKLKTRDLLEKKDYSVKDILDSIAKLFDKIETLEHEIKVLKGEE